MEALKKLRLTRGQLKGTVTRIENFINDPINIASSSTEMLEARKEKLITTFKEYEVVQLDILSLDASDSEDVATLENKYFAVISKLNAALKTLNTTEVRLCSNVSSSKLPHLDIPIFNGRDYTKYTSFMDLFTAVIDNNTTLSDVQKLFYLRKFLTEDALAVIVNLPLVNPSYKEALILLKKRFDNKSRLISNHINVILELPSMQKGTAAAIRAFISQLQQQLHALKNLEQPIHNWDMLLITLLTKKLDQYTCRAYQLDRNLEVLPTMEEFMSFLEKRAIALEDSTESKKSTIANKVSNVVTKNKSTTYQCLYCDGTDHAMYVCPRFKTAPIEDRTKFVENKKLCTICLKNHTGKCRFNFTCKVCRAGHNTLLHKDSNPAAEQSVSLHSHDASVNVLLPTIRVKVIDRHGSDMFVRGLLDSASQVSFVTTELVEKLGLKTKFQTSNIVGIGNKNQKINKCVNLTIQSPANDVKLNVKCNVVDSITSHLPQHSFDITKLKIPTNICLADDKFNVTDVISILLSAEIYFNILLDGQVKIQDGPVLQNTLFGYTVAGSIPTKSIVPSTQCENKVVNLAICNSNKLEEVMEQFWLSESIPQPATKQYSQEFKKAESCFKESVQLQDKRFIVKMPLMAKKTELQLGDSFSVAHQRFLTLEKKFKKNTMYLEKYKKFIDEYLELGHGKIVDIGNYNIQDGSTYFLAHHAVFNEESLTTKLRVVFDGSMKSRSGVSLNDVMLNGPVVQSELFDILIVWRTFIYTLICDIQKMFRSVIIDPAQTSLQNILWRDNPHAPISCIQLQTVTYGLKASTFLATRCLIELADRYGASFPLAAQAMRTSTYIDDVIGGSDSLEQLQQLKGQLIELLEKGSFILHKWSSNCPQLLDDLPKEVKYFEVLDINNSNIIKTLGLKCDILLDQLSFTAPLVEKNYVNTKRKVLSFIGKMFDPLGLIGPIIVTAKLFMQKLWSIKIDWDSIMPHEQLCLWEKFLDNLKLMGSISIPRCVNSTGKVYVELVGYADASFKALGCCLYLRVFNADGTVFVNLLCSKSRVAPLNKSITIPKLELNSALLLSELTCRVSKVLKDRVPLKLFLYSDSQIVLAWIKSANLKSNPYVSKRVNQIRELNKGVSWHYVNTADNPADLLSRGCDPQKLQSKELWWHGPKDLSRVDYTHSITEPKLHIPLDSEIDHVDPVVNNCNVGNISSGQKHTFPKSFFERFSDINKLQRIVAYILRFRNNSNKNNVRLVGVLTPKELHNALLVIMRCTQENYFSNEISLLKSNSPIKSGLSSLHPFIDSDGLVRLGGRLQNASDIPYDRKHPVILPKGSHVTNIIIHKEHLRLLHAGAKLVIGSLSQKFWIISAIREVKKVVNRCIKCARLKAAAAVQLMGSLPKERLTAVRPFHIVGVDFCGPFNIKVSRIRKPLITKGYIALFVCFATKAIHVELVSDLTTEAFLACLKRFIGRRGMPVNIFCDNAKTFKGTENELNKLHDLFNSKKHVDEVQNYCVPNYIKFKFIPSYSPEFGGLWEAGVKSLKYHFKRIVGNIALTFEAFYTVIVEIEAVLNSRPLLPFSSDVSNFEYLTPGHFLIGTAMTTFPEVDHSNVPINRLRFWNMLSKIKQDFWSVWSRDYLTQLQSRPKWKQVHPNLNEGDLVIVRSDNTAPLTWPMARIDKIVPGPDGQVRVAHVKMANNKLYTRSLRKLCPLPLV